MGPDAQADVAGSAAALVALTALSVALIVGRTAPWSVIAVLSTVAAVGGAIGFVVAERRATNPILPLRFFRRRRFVGATACGCSGA